MAKEAKIGLTVLAVLIGIFGYLLFRRLSRQEDAPVVAVNKEAEPADDDSDGALIPSESMDGKMQHGSDAHRGDRAADDYYKNWKSSDDPWPPTDQSPPQAVTQAGDHATEPAPFQSTADSKAYGTDTASGDRSESKSGNEDWNRYVQQGPQASDGYYDHRHELSDSSAAQAPYRQDDPSQQLQSIPGAPRSLLPADESAYDGSDAVQTAGTQTPTRTGTSSRRGYDQSRSDYQPRSTQPTYRPGQYGRSQYSPQSQVPSFNNPALQSSTRSPSGATRGYGPAQRGAAGIEQNNSALGSRGSGRSAVSADRYVVRPKDSFWDISKRLYGTGAYFKALYEHNRRRYPRADQLRPGDIVDTPSRSVLEQTYPELCPAQVRALDANSAASRNIVQQTVTSKMRSRLGGPIYVVEKGDTLFDIARYELGTAARWGEIYELNRNLLGDDVDYLRPGTELVLPPAARDQPFTQRPSSSSSFRR